MCVWPICRTCLSALLYSILYILVIIFLCLVLVYEIRLQCVWRAKRTSRNVIIIIITMVIVRCSIGIGYWNITCVLVCTVSNKLILEKKKIIFALPVHSHHNLLLSNVLVFIWSIGFALSFSALSLSFSIFLDGCRVYNIAGTHSKVYRFLCSYAKRICIYISVVNKLGTE